MLTPHDNTDESIYPTRVDKDDEPPADIEQDLPKIAYHEDFWQRTWEIQAGYSDY